MNNRCIIPAEFVIKPALCRKSTLAPVRRLPFRNDVRLALLALGLVVSLAAAEPASPAPPAPSSELGLPFFDVFDPRDYRGHMQVWGAVRDAAGRSYLGNYGRVLVYDGARWEHIEVPGTSFVRALAIDKDDVLWIGAVNELGYAATDATGRRTFTSLRD